MSKSALLLTTLVIVMTTGMANTVFGLGGPDFPLDGRFLTGCGLGVLAVIASIRIRARWQALLVVALVLAALLMAGYSISFFAMVNLAFGPVSLLTNTDNELTVTASLAVGLVALGGLMSQSWCLLRAYAAWQRSTPARGVPTH